jgi:hypothetical protein
MRWGAWIEGGNGGVYVVVSEAGGVVWVRNGGAVLKVNAGPLGVIIVAVQTQTADVACI